MLHDNKHSHVISIVQSCELMASSSTFRIYYLQTITYLFPDNTFHVNHFSNLKLIEKLLKILTESKREPVFY